MHAFTPLLFPFLYALMVYVEAPISGTSTNPARGFGPGLVADVWRGWWIYWAGPTVGALLAVAVHQWSPLRHLRIEVAKIYHFQRDPHGLFHYVSGVRTKATSDGSRQQIGRCKGEMLLPANNPGALACHPPLCMLLLDDSMTKKMCICPVTKGYTYANQTRIHIS